MPAGERLYRALAILVVGAITASTAVLIAAIALISRKKSVSKPPVRDADQHQTSEPP